VTAILVAPCTACAVRFERSGSPDEGAISDGIHNAKSVGSRAGSRGDFDWPMFRYNMTHQGATPSPGPQNNTLLWSNTTYLSGNIYASPIIANDILVIGDTNSRVYAFDAKTGREMWNNTTSSSGGDYGVSSTAAYSDGKVVVANNFDDSLYCFNISTGERIWKSKSAYSGGYGGGSITIDNNVIYAGMPNNRLTAVNFTDGTSLWNFTIGANDEYGVSSTPVIVNNMVIFGASDRYVYAVNITTHALVWKFLSGGEFYATPTVVGDRIYIGNGTYRNDISNVAMFCLDLDGFADGNDGWTNESLTGGTDGDLIWRYNMTTGGQSIVSSVAYWNDTIYFGSYDNYMYSLNATTGAYNWRFTTSGDILASPAVSDSIVYISSADSKLYAVYWNNGTQKWAHTGSGGSHSSPAIANGVAYYATISGNIYAVGQYVTLGPSVMTTSPTPGAAGVAKTASVTATFNKALNAATVTGSTFTLVDHLGSPVTGTVSYNGPTLTATFDPTSDLTALETYTAKLTTGIQDMAAMGMKQDFSWSFTVGNTAPVLSAYGFGPATGNTSTQFNFFVTYTDIDGQAPTSIKISLDNTTPIAMTVNGSAAGGLIDGNFSNGEQYVYNTTLNASAHSFTINATDGIGWFATPQLNGPVVTSPVNMPPVIAAIPAQTATEDVALTVNLVPYMTDPDNTTAQLSLTAVTALNTTNVTYFGLNVTLTYGEGVANDRISLTVTDGLNSVNGGFDVTVTAVNDPVTLDALPAQTVNENVSKTLDISTHIHDIDTPISSMVVTTNSTYVKASGTILNMTVPGPARDLVVNVTVDDGANEASRDIIITVLTSSVANEPPTIGGVPDQTVDPGVAKTLDITPYVNDDSPIDGLVVTTNSSHITVSGLVLTLNYPAGFGKEYVEITVNDGEYSASFTIIVNENGTTPPPPTNKAPIIMSSAISADAGNPDTTFTFTLKARDEDDDTLSAVLVVDGKDFPMTKKGGTFLAGADFSYDGKFAAGNHTYRFRVDDGAGATNSKVLSVEKVFSVTTGGGGGGDDGGTASGGLGGSMLPILLVVIIIIVVALVAVMMMRKKKGGPQPSDMAQSQQQPLDPSLGYPEQGGPGAGAGVGQTGEAGAPVAPEQPPFAPLPPAGEAGGAPPSPPQ